ncbi:hypothetical protein T01_13906 [Trichinella spiralis]|uniref:Uncharacterized protein n=1 Tax=Trichinella spiralis TaxID=6334 RepID=A0A0V1BMS9_TRISP|nr:hypothetical protein T01_13906 [Trichinella spiralis]
MLARNALSITSFLEMDNAVPAFLGRPYLEDTASESSQFSTYEIAMRAYVGTSTASVFSVCVRLAFTTASGNRTRLGRAVAWLAINHYATPPSNR